MTTTSGGSGHSTGSRRGVGTVVCLGDLVEDVVVRARGDVRRGTDTGAVVVRRRGGSAANVAVAASRAGAPARFVGCVGSDRLGDALVADLRREGVGVAAERRGRTGTVVALVDPTGERSFLTDRGAASDLLALPDGALDDVGVLHVPAYSLEADPTAGVARRAVERARARGALVSVDASSRSVLERIGATALTDLRPDLVHANADEADALGVGPGRPLPGARTLVLSAGAGPTLIVDEAGAATEVAVPALVGVTDTTGAGDAFVGGLLAGILVGRAAGGTPDLRAAVAAGHAASAARLELNAAVWETE